MHLERLLQGGIGGSEQPPSVAGGPPLLAEGGGSPIPTAAEFSIALRALTGHDSEPRSALAKILASRAETSPVSGVAEQPEGTTEAPTATDVGTLLAEGASVQSVAGIPLAAAASDVATALGLAKPEITATTADVEGATVPSTSGDASISDRAVGGGLPSTVGAGAPGDASTSSGAGASEVGAQAPGSAAVSTPVSARRERGVVGPSSDQATNAAGGGTTDAQASGAAATTADGSESGATTADRSGSGAAAAVRSGVASSGAVEVPSPGGSSTVSEQEASTSVRATPQEIEEARVERERTANAGTSETRAATRPEGVVDPVILSAVRVREEAPPLRQPAPAIGATRGDVLAPSAGLDATTDDSGLATALEAEQPESGAAVARAGGNTTIASTLEVLAREASQRQRVQATVLPSSSGSEADGSMATQTAGTQPPAAPAAATGILARIDQPQGFAALAERIADALHLSAARGGSEIRLRVEPPGLGHIDVRIQLQEDGVRAMIVAEHETTRALLSGQQHLLEAALNRSELRLSGFSVDVSPDHGAQGAMDFHDAEEGSGRAELAALERGEGDGNLTDDSTVPVSSLDDGHLSLRV